MNATLNKFIVGAWVVITCIWVCGFFVGFYQQESHELLVLNGLLALFSFVITTKSIKIMNLEHDFTELETALIISESLLNHYYNRAQELEKELKPYKVKEAYEKLSGNEGLDKLGKGLKDMSSTLDEYIAP